MMKEQDLIDLGFEKQFEHYISDESDTTNSFYYYTYDIGNGIISLITQSNDEVENNKWYVEVFEDASIRFETIEDITKFIQVTEKNIIR